MLSLRRPRRTRRGTRVLALDPREYTRTTMMRGADFYLLKAWCHERLSINLLHRVLN